MFESCGNGRAVLRQRRALLDGSSCSASEQFYERVQRNQLFARWAAKQMGFRGDEYRACIGFLIAAAIRSDPDAALIEQVGTDLLAGGVDVKITAIKRVGTGHRCCR